MNPWIATLYMLSQLAKDLVGLGGSGPMVGILETCYMRLFTAPTPTPTPFLTLAGITEATYDGYAAQQIVWRPTFVDQAGPQDLLSTQLFWQPTDSTIPNDITGAFIATAATGGLLLWAAAFANPIALPGPTSAFSCAALIQFSFTANYGRCLVAS